MMGKGLWRYSMVVVLLAVTMNECCSKLVKKNHATILEIEVTSWISNQKTTSDTREEIKSYMDQAVNYLVKVGEKPKDKRQESDPAESSRKEDPVVTEKMHDAIEERALWGKMGKKTDGEIMVLVEYPAVTSEAAMWKSVVQRAETIVRRISSCLDIIHQIWEITGVHQGSSDKKGGAVRVGVYITQSCLSLGTTNMQAEKISVAYRSSKSHDPVNNNELSFSSVERTAPTIRSPDIRGLLKKVLASECSTTDQSDCTWTDGKLEASYREKENVDAVVAGPLKGLMVHILYIMWFASIDNAPQVQEPCSFTAQFGALKLCSVSDMS